MNELRVVAVIPADPESTGDLGDAIRRLAEATRAEDGCVSYEVFESAAVPGTFVTVEEWRSQADLDAHLQTEHVQAAIAAAQEHLVGDIAIHPLAPLA